MGTPAKRNSRIEEFCGLIQAGIEAWTRAGKLLCKLVDEDATVFAKILEARPYLTRDTLENFERIGRRQLYPYLAVDASPGARRLMTLPYEDQERLYNARVTVVVQGKGFTEQKFKRVFELTEAEARRVFDSERIRTAQEQIALLNRPRRTCVRARATNTIQAEDLEPESTAGTASLDAKPEDELQRLLTLANDALLEARSVLATIARGSKQDDHITTALREIGALRFAARSGELKAA